MTASTVPVKLGEATVQVPPLTIYALRQCWDHISALGQAPGVVDSAHLILRILVAAQSVQDGAPRLDTPEGEAAVVAMEKLVGPAHYEQLSLGVQALFRASGLAPREADPLVEPPAPATSSTETGTPSSPS